MVEFVFLVGAVVLWVVFYAVLTALPLMWLWNWLMPYLFALPTISFWQALGIAVLAGILFPRASNKS